MYYNKNEVIRLKINKKAYVSILVSILLAFSLNNVYATTKVVEKSEKFKKWETLSKKEKEETKQPSYNGIKLIDSVKRSTYNKLVGAPTTLETKFSLVDTLPTGSIIKREQLETKLCWAMSYANMLDTNATLLNKKAYNFSAVYTDYMAVKNFYKRSPGDMGNYDMALAISVSGNGPVYENDMKFTDYYNETEKNVKYTNVDESKLQAKAKINESVEFAEIYKQYEGTTIKYLNSSYDEYDQSQVNAIRTQIKKHIKEKGAVMALTYIPTDATKAKEMFNVPENGYAAFCCKDTELLENHGIVIVGWDDNYSKENFANSKNKPLNNGAYLVLNSTGTEKLQYYYISYEDYFIEQYVRGINSIQVYAEKGQEKNYNNLYQYDELGYSMLGYELKSDDSETPLQEVYTANVFTRNDKTKKEYINEVGIFVPITEGIEIYIDTADGDMKNYGEAVASYTGDKALEPGYHAIKLGTPKEITGDKFAVIVKHINQNGAAYALECNLKDSGLTEEYNIFSSAKAQNGQSFVSSDGKTWSDINGHELNLGAEEKYEFKNTNTCIKAFTKTEEQPEETVEVTSVSLNKTSTEIEVGKTETLKATVNPSNATNQKVKWTSSDENIATVAGGVVEGKKEGTATITVTTEDGNKTATCKVTVKKVEIPTIEVTSVSLNKTSTEIEVGKTETLKATVNPSNATNQKVKWTSSDENIATVAGGVVEGKKEGTATITVTTEDGNKTAICTVVVKTAKAPIVAVESISLDKSMSKMEEGSVLNLIATLNPSDATNKNVRWESSDENIATVNSSGVVKAISEGKVIIKAISEDGDKEAVCEIVVTKKVNDSDDIYNADDDYDDYYDDYYEDPTLADDSLPNTGKVILCIIAVAILGFGVIKFMNYRKYKNI